VLDGGRGTAAGAGHYGLGSERLSSSIEARRSAAAVLRAARTGDDFLGSEEGADEDGEAADDFNPGRDVGGGDDDLADAGGDVFEGGVARGGVDRAGGVVGLLEVLAAGGYKEEAGDGEAEVGDAVVEV
jgi:hypothetical protein